MHTGTDGRHVRYLEERKKPEQTKECLSQEGENDFPCSRDSYFNKCSDNFDLPQSVMTAAWNSFGRLTNATGTCCSRAPPQASSAFSKRQTSTQCTFLSDNVEYAHVTGLNGFAAGTYTRCRMCCTQCRSRYRSWYSIPIPVVSPHWTINTRRHRYRSSRTNERPDYLVLLEYLHAYYTHRLVLQ